MNKAETDRSLLKLWRRKLEQSQSGPERTATHSTLSGPRYRGSNPCLPAKFEARAGTSRNFKIHNHFAAVSTPSATRTPFSQPNSNSRVVLLNEFDRAVDLMQNARHFRAPFDQKTRADWLEMVVRATVVRRFGARWGGLAKRLATIVTSSRTMRLERAALRSLDTHGIIKLRGERRNRRG